MVVRKFLVIFLLLPGFTACSHQPAVKRYPVEGRVVAVDSGTHELTIAHKEIPGYMEAMTMPYTVSKTDSWIFQSIAPGDQIHATLVLGEQAELQDISFSRSGETKSDGTSDVRIPQTGDQVPDFTLVNQNGKIIHLQQFRGKPLLLTFIYTRCPFPDYCPRMSNNFSQILQHLQKDPEHDKPAALHSYGEHYVGRLDPRFAHWEFASGSPEQVRKIADFFGLSYNEKDSQIVHGLVTVLVGKDGTVAKVYSGNDWIPEQVAADFVAAAGA
jgi:protein SCO1